jgi:hypothetical protein
VQKRGRDKNRGAHPGRRKGRTGWRAQRGRRRAPGPAAASPSVAAAPAPTTASSLAARGGSEATRRSMGGERCVAASAVGEWSDSTLNSETGIFTCNIRSTFQTGRNGMSNLQEGSHVNNSIY